MENQQYYSTGRRKTATARVYIKEGKGSTQVNGKPLEKYFPIKSLQMTAVAPLKVSDLEGSYDVKAFVKGGGQCSQASALRHGLARAIVTMDSELKPNLRKAGFITRDSREVERKKPGLHKSRKRPQYSKR